MTPPIKHPDLFRQVRVEDYNRDEEAKGSPIRAEDRNGNGLVDNEDAFHSVGAQDLNLKTGVHLHRMCMERLAELKTDWHGYNMTGRYAGGISLSLSVGKRAVKNLHSYNPTGIFSLWKYPLLGLFIGFLGGRKDLTRGPDGLIPVIYVEGRYDADLQGCNYNKAMTVKGGASKNILKVTYENATGEHKEIWNFKTERTRVVR